MNTNDVALFGFIVSYTKNIKFLKQLHEYTTKCSTALCGEQSMIFVA